MITVSQGGKTGWFVPMNYEAKGTRRLQKYMLNLKLKLGFHHERGWASGDHIFSIFEEISSIIDISWRIQVFIFGSEDDCRCISRATIPIPLRLSYEIQIITNCCNPIIQQSEFSMIMCSHALITSSVTLIVSIGETLMHDPLI
jgi:hypothetical protein